MASPFDLRQYSLVDSRLLSREQLEEHLHRQIRHLRNSAALWDAGDEDEAVRLGTTVRILMHESRTSRSLLGQLGIRETLSYLDTSEPYTGDHKMLSLVFLNPFGEPHQWMPYRGHADADQFVDRATWWDSAVIKTFTETGWISRRELVRFMANQDGGAHVDPSIDVAYDDFTRANFGITFTSRANSREPWSTEAASAGVAGASMRQIAFEIEETLIQAGHIDRA